MLPRTLSRSANQFIDCRVVLLDNSEFSTTFKSKEIQGGELFDQVCEKAEIPPQCRKYFGLQHMDRRDGEMNWLLSNSRIRPSKKRGKSRNFQLAVKVFPEDPLKLKYSLTVLKLLVFQLKYLITKGNMLLPLNQHAVLDGYFAQAVLGDYNIKDHGYGYLEGLLGSTFFSRPSYINSNFDISDSVYEKMATNSHKSRKGMTTQDALMAFLDLCHASQSYGKLVHKGATDSSSKNVLFVISTKGLQIAAPNEFREPGELMHDFPWEVVHSIMCDKSKLILTVKPGGPDTTAQVIYIFRCHGHFGFLQAERLVTDCLNHSALALNKATFERKVNKTQSLEDLTRANTLAVPPSWRKSSFSPLMSLRKQMRVGAITYV